MTDRHHDAARGLLRRAHEADPVPVELDTAAGLAALLARARHSGLRRSAVAARYATSGAVVAVVDFDLAADDSRARRALVHEWAHRLGGVESEERLNTMLDTLCQLLHVTPFVAEPAEKVAEELVAVGVTGFRCTTEVLGAGLPELPEFQPVERYAGRIAQVLGALGNGFATASRKRVSEEQESTQRALLQAVHDAKRNLRAAEARFDEVVTSSRIGILIADLDGRLVDANEAACDMLGRTPDALAGWSLLDLAAPASAESFRDKLTQLRQGTSERFRDTLWLVGAGGAAVMVSVAASLLRGAMDEPSHYVVMIESEAEVTLLHNELVRQLRHDALTGLPNRATFSAHLEAVLHRADRRSGVTLFHLGLDAFDAVCDGLGRHAGERLLQHVAQRLRSIVAHERAMVARLDGDEFGIVVENSAQTPEIPAVMAMISAELAEPVYVDGHGIAVSVSAGIVCWPSYDVDPAELLRAADSTLHRTRRGHWRVFDPRQDAADRRDDALAVVMPGAWENGEIDVRYRPVRNLRLDAVAAVEAELYWDRPDAPEPLPHARCAALAERTGLVIPLGEWLLRNACEQVRWWRQRKQFDGPLAVRLTAHQATDEDLVPRIVRVLHETGVEAHQLMLSMPASVLSDADAMDNLDLLADRGVYTMLDDFRLGPLDVAEVRSLRVACVRLPRELVPDRSPQLTTLLPAMRQEGVAVAVDGIDSAETARWWRDAGADFGAGDFVGASSEAGQLVGRLGLM